MARRQEREPAREEVSEVAPGILRMELPIRLPGLGHVNCYALLDDEGCALMDPGLPGPGTWRALRARLERAGLRLPDVHTVVVTHSHPDHFGAAERLRREVGARVIAHRRFSFGPPPAGLSEPEVSVEHLGGEPDDEPETESPEVEPPAPPAKPGTTPWGGRRPGLRLGQHLLWRTLRLLGRGSFVPVITHPVEHGDELHLAGRDLFVLHTPGHTCDHVCLHDPETGTFLAGDHVLPTITPHISGLSSSRDPLASFFYSLDRVAEITGVKQVLPAHGHPFDDLRSRTQAIKRHHYERLEKLKAISRELGPAPVRAFSERLFQRRSWGPMAESETYAHLEHLRLAGEAERYDDGRGTPLYVAG
ncbi:MAG: MBL fold metallo-hydrolase [Myxococcota bacterium]